MKALRRQCFQTTFHSGTPLMRASFTNSVSSTSSIEERIRRSRAATWKKPRVNAGMIMWERPPLPEDGSQPSCTANSHNSMMPSQKLGTDWPRKATALPW